jgi:iron complex outermembrane receptor protein
LRFKSRRFEGEVMLFGTRFDDFIFLEPNGLVNMDSGLPEAVYTQADADFRGVEFHGDLHLAEHLVLEVLADAVRAENLETGRPLPRIPPARVGVALTWESDRFYVTGEVRAAARQDRVTPAELETGGSTVYNLFGGYTVAAGGVVHRFGLRAENLTDTLYRNHVSLTKDIVPQPGRNVQLTYRLLF